MVGRLVTEASQALTASRDQPCGNRNRSAWRTLYHPTCPTLLSISNRLQYQLYLRLPASSPLLLLHGRTSSPSQAIVLLPKFKQKHLCHPSAHSSTHYATKLILSPESNQRDQTKEIQAETKKKKEKQNTAYGSITSYQSYPSHKGYPTSPTPSIPPPL